MANWLSGYTTRKKITIDKSKIDSDLTDFPVLVKLTSSNFDFSRANSDGFDLRFTSADGTTLLKYERERHDATNKLAEYWVKIPSISSTANTDFFIYFRSLDTDDGADPTNVWDSSFKMVQHMNDKTTSTIEDSTSNNNDGTKKAANEPTQADGKVAKAQSFDGNNDYIQLPNMNMQPITLSMWAKADVLEEAEPFSFYGGRVGIKLNTTGFLLSYYDGAWHIIQHTSQAGTWYHLTGVIPASVGTTRFYVNGSEEGSNSVGSVHFYTGSTNYTGLGAVKTTNWINFFDGLIDEVRISNVARSAAWIKASYYSENNSLVSYGAEEGIDNAIFFSCNF